MKFLLLFCLSASIISCRIDESNLTQEEVFEVIRQFDQGWMSKNIKSVDSVLAPSYIYFTQSGGTFGRASLVQTAGGSEYILDHMERTDIHVKLYGNTAVVSTRWRGRGMYKGLVFNEDQRCSLTIVKLGGKVTILTEHCAPIGNTRILH